jgi:restriction endonuclease Mrr
MNFIEAALLLLKKSRRSLTVEQLVEQAENEDLLDKPGKDPQRSMKAALSRELKGGDDSRVVQVGDDRYRLAKGAAKEVQAAKPAKKTGQAATKTTKKAAAKPAAQKPAAQKATAQKATAQKATAQKAQKATAKPARDTTAARKAKQPAKAKEPAKAPVEAEELAPPDTVIETAPEALEGRVDYNDIDAAIETPAEAAAEPGAETPGRRTSRNRRRRGRKGGAAQTAAALVPVAEDEETTAEAATLAIEPVPEEVSAEVAEVLAPRELPVRAETAEAPAEDEELEAIYGDELSGTEPGAAFAEYRDAQTEDEDRPMLPEIVATRRDRQKRDRRRRRRYRGGEERDVEQRDVEPRAVEPRAVEPRAVEPRAVEPRAVEPRVREVQLELELPAIAAGPAGSRPGNAIGQGAAEVLRAGNGSQPTRAKQIALMMRKRQLLSGDPEQLWPHVKAALISDEQDRLARGMRPRVVYRGRDQFALAEGPIDPALADAEDAMERATAAMAAATHGAVQARLGALDLAALERVVHVLLVRQGWQQIEWIKRVQRSAYAVAQAPDGLGTMLVGVRAGDQPVDRRGVGELRVGIQAKKLPGGLLVAPQPLSEAGRQELRRNGPSISLLVGDALVSMLIQNGIGVRTGQVPVSLVDDAFFREVAID